MRNTNILSNVAFKIFPVAYTSQGLKQGDINSKFGHVPTKSSFHYRGFCSGRRQ